MGFRTTGNVHPSSALCCVLFDPTSGRIFHIHHVVTMPGAKETSKPEMESRIVELAKERGVYTDRLQLLHVDPKEIVRGARYLVNPKTLKLEKHAS